MCAVLGHSAVSTLCNPSDCSLPGSSVHGILQARILEWVASPSSRQMLYRLSDQGSPKGWDELKSAFHLDFIANLYGSFLGVAQLVKNLPTMQETWVPFLGQEDPLEKEMATHSSVLAWRIQGMRKPGGLPSMGSHRVGHD